jgi:UDP-glucose 4-epimerase
MRILILGTTGFIGSNLIKLLQSRMYDVSTLKRLEFLDPNKVLGSIEVSDVVINCIGSANVGFSFSNTNDDFESNVGVVRKVLEILRIYNLNHIKFINLSSAAVYGNPSRLPVKETDTTEPLSPYGYHKLMAELLLREYSRCFGLNTLSLRIFSAYGNGQKKLLLFDLHDKIQKSKEKIILFGTGNESRDFIHIDDIAQQILLIINNAEFAGESINVANGAEVKISEIVDLYQRHYPKKFDYEFNGEGRLGDPKNWCANISTMINWGYKQSVLIDEGIDNYIKHIICD